jgi:cytochrome c5
MDEPYPCKFCGQAPTLGNPYIKGRQYSKLSCLDCHADGFPRLTVEEARADWNERHGKKMTISTER